MAATIIYLVISLLVSLIFIILGIRQYRAEKPVAINTGEKAPREDELISVTEWNHRHGRNFIILGCALFITLSIVAYFIEKLDGVALQVATVIFVIVIFAEIVWVGFEHNVMKKKMIKKKCDVFVTGSNAKFLSRDIATEFVGRGDEVHLI